MNMSSPIFVNFDVIRMVYTCVCMYMSYNEQTQNINETLERGSNDNADVFEVLMDISPCTLRSCVLTPHKFRLSQIATNPENLPT